MWLYLLIFIIPVMLYARPYGSNRSQSSVELGIYLAFLALFVGMADMLGGYDRYIYGEVFDDIADVTTYGENYLLSGCFFYFNVEVGYTLLNILISFFTENRYIFILIITIIVYTCLYVSLKRYAKNYPLALILFLGLWFFFTFTYLRQVLGATIAWLALPYVTKRKFWKFLIIWLIACSLHKSAILFLPIYFIGTHFFHKNTVILIMILALILGMSPIPESLFQAYGDASQVELQADYNSSGGFRIAYFLEAVFFLWIILRNYNFRNACPNDKLMLNTALCFCGLLLFFIRSENGGRISWYFMIGIICTLTNIATRRSKSKNLAQLLIVLSLFLMVRVYFSWQIYMNLYPYKTFLTEGVRQGDHVWDEYEYDHKYDINKLYRTPFRIKLGLNKNQWTIAP